MATIYSNRGNEMIHPIMNWNDSSTWQGGIVPTASDTAYVYGYRTTINQTAINSWSDTINITVSSTTGFPLTNGFFYTYTTRGKKLKIDYLTKTSTIFQNCSIDSTYQQFDNNIFEFGGQIANGSYVHSPAPIVTIDNDVIGTALTTFVEQAGILHIQGTGEYWVQDYLQIRDGKLLVEDFAKIRHKKLKNISRILFEAYSLQEINFNGAEVRTNTFLTQDCQINSHRLSCDNTSDFEKGDLISVYNDENTIELKRRDNSVYTQEGKVSSNYNYFVSDINPLKMDEGFIVVDKDENNLYYKTRSGLEATILKSEKIDNKYQYITVNETRFRSGDKILINKELFSILEVSDDYYTEKDIDFLTGITTDLNDFETDESIHPYSSDWTITNSLLRCNSTSYRQLIIKDVFLKDFKMEAWISPLNNYVSGTRSSSYFGIIFSDDPASDRHRGYVTDSSVRGCFSVEDGNDRFYFSPRNSAYGFTYLYTLTSFNLRTLCRSNFKVTVEYKYPFAKLYINDVYITEKPLVSDAIAGRFGVMSNGNNMFSCARICISKPVQKLKIFKSELIATGSTVYQTGNEFYHSSESKVLKIASILTSAASHTNYAWTYGGYYNRTWQFPVAMGVNANTSVITFPEYLGSNLNNNESYYTELGTGADKYFTYDLITEKYFTHIGLTNRHDADYNQNKITNIQFFASNDNTNWTEIYAKQPDNRLSIVRSAIRYYEVTPGTWRYLKISMSGNSSTSNYNRPVNLGVFDFTNGYTLTLNNASDFNIGDRVHIVSHSYYSTGNIPTAEQYFYNTITNGTYTADDYVSKLKGYYTINGITGNTISFDEPITTTFINGDEYVVKISRNLQILGDLSINYSKGDFYRTFSSSIRYSRLILKNVEFINHSAGRWGQGSNATGLVIGSLEPFNPLIMDGVSYHSGFNDYSYNFTPSYYSPTIMRNCYFADLYNTAPYPCSTNASGPVGLFNSIFVNTSSTFWGARYLQSCKTYTNYNILQSAITLTNPGYSYLNLNMNVDIRQNIFDGSYYCLYFSNSISMTTGAILRVNIKNNFIRSNNGVIFYSYNNWDTLESDSFIFNSFDFSYRVNRWDYNQTMLSPAPNFYNGVNSYNFMKLNRFDDTIFYNTRMIGFKKDTTDYYRYYPNSVPVDNTTINGASIYLGINFHKIDSSITYVNLGFDYRLSYDICKINVSWLNNNSLYLVAVLDGLEIDKVFIQKNTDYSENFSTFTYDQKFSEAGIYYIYITSNNMCGYVDMKNSYAHVAGGNSNDRILSNSFKDFRIGEVSPEIRNMYSTDTFIKTGLPSTYNKVIFTRKIKGK